MVGVNVPLFGETTQTIERFIEQTQVSFDILRDVEETFGGFAWEESVSPFPREVLIDADGRILYMSSDLQLRQLREAIEGALAALP